MPILGKDDIPRPHNFGPDEQERNYKSSDEKKNDFQKKDFIVDSINSLSQLWIILRNYNSAEVYRYIYWQEPYILTLMYIL